MEKILGIDLGTNSIGLTLREDNEFPWFGVYTFKKGVGEGKTGEFSYAAERTKHRSSRRLYNARRYRKWETLKVLIELDYCPLGEENLNKWKHFEKGIGRVFPIDDILFQQWLKLDFNFDNVPDYSSPYQLRRILITEKLDLLIPENRYKIGRALFHIAQRRGFKSSRKSGANEKTAVYKGSSETKTIGRDEYQNLIAEKGSLGAAFAYLEEQGNRVRNRYTLRADYQKEVQDIIKFQGIENKSFIENIEKAIFFQRPLRSQKGLVGKCTLEPNKPRCPISHPKFEEYRAWSFINNIKYKKDTNSIFEPIPLELRIKLYNEKFFFKSKREFPFSEIRKFIKSNGGKDWELNYSQKMDDISVSSCFVSAALKSVFGDNWQNYKKTVIKTNKRGESETINYSINDIWHLLFSFEDEEYFIEFLHKTFDIEEKQIKELKNLFNSFPVGYANLSLKAINNILPFLHEGLIYTEAVILAKIPEIIGEQLFEENKEYIFSAIKDEISNNRHEKEIITIANNLIFKYYALDYDKRFAWKDFSYKLTISDYADIKIAIVEHFGEKTWNKKVEAEQTKIHFEVTEKYQSFFADEKREHIKPPHLVNQIKEFLIRNFNIDEKQVERIYHPSQIDIYPKTEDQTLLKSPKTAAFKNPMAYKTLYRLRDVINHLIKIGKIDNETKIVIEIARELNDANKRNAIETYQRRREVENKEFAIAISELLKDPEFKGIASPDNKSDKEKFRLWAEQIVDGEDLMKNIIATKDDIKKYRLWREQNCQCIYTGKVIKITDLFNTNTIDFEHTIPRSKSFDNSLANLTVCYADYNRDIKKNRIPKELENYSTDALGYSAIEPRLKPWLDKIASLKERIFTQVLNSKKAIDKKTKDEAIVRRHILNEELKYWENKVDRFTRDEIPQGFVNSQLRDTQIITKYAYHYLKTVFNKVDVQKGEVTAQFRKIYQIQEKDEKKSRSKHHHHAIDAAVLTLIPDSAKREEILKKYYAECENYIKREMPEKPFKGFHQNMIAEIEKTILINNIPDKDRALEKSKRIIRKRGSILWLRNSEGKLILDEKGKKIPKIAQGDCIRGELHAQTFYGKVKVVQRNVEGKPLRDNENNWIYDDKNEGFRFVIRIPIEKLTSIEQIVDPYIAKMIEKQLEGRKLSEAITSVIYMLDKDGNKVNKIRRIRTWARSTNLLTIKQQTYKSKTKEYKNYYYADTGDNYAFALYISEDGKKKIISRNLFEISQFADKSIVKTREDLFEKTINISKTTIASLYHVFQPGQKVLFFERSKEELKEIDNLSNRLYYVHTLFSSDDGRIRFQHHIEARNDEQLNIDFPSKDFGVRGKNGFSKFSTDFIQPRLLLSPINLNCIIEDKEFKMTKDGKIEFLF